MLYVKCSSYPKFQFPGNGNKVEKLITTEIELLQDYYEGKRQGYVLSRLFKLEIGDRSNITCTEEQPYIKFVHRELFCFVYNTQCKDTVNVKTIR